MVVFHAWSLQYGRTALHFAAAYGREDMIRLLLSNKANPNKIGGVRQLTNTVMIESKFRSSAMNTKKTSSSSQLIGITI